MLPLVPVNEPPSVPVTVCTVPAPVSVVKTTVATPLASVVLVAVANYPPLVLLQFTISPAVLTALLLTSASCAVMVTSLPATGPVLLDVTRY